MKTGFIIKAAICLITFSLELTFSRPPVLFHCVYFNQWHHFFPQAFSDSDTKQLLTKLGGVRPGQIVSQHIHTPLLHLHLWAFWSFQSTWVWTLGGNQRSDLATWKTCKLHTERLYLVVVDIMCWNLTFRSRKWMKCTTVNNMAAQNQKASFFFRAHV